MFSESACNSWSVMKDGTRQRPYITSTCPIIDVIFHWLRIELLAFSAGLNLFFHASRPIKPYTKMIPEKKVKHISYTRVPQMSELGQPIITNLSGEVH